jgi:hypothetical protein
MPWCSSARLHDVDDAKLLDNASVNVRRRSDNTVFDEVYKDPDLTSDTTSVLVQRRDFLQLKDAIRQPADNMPPERVTSSGMTSFIRCSTRDAVRRMAAVILAGALNMEQIETEGRFRCLTDRKSYRIRLPHARAASSNSLAATAAAESKHSVSMRSAMAPGLAPIS